MKRKIRLAFILSVAVFIQCSLAQESDSAINFTPQPLIDPSVNKIYLMPTGQIAPEGTLSITSVNVLYCGIEYTPTNFLQLHGACVLPIFDLVENKKHDGYYSMGLKVALLQHFYFIQGFSLGGDVMITGKENETIIFPEKIKHYEGIFDELFDINYLRTNPYVGSINIAGSIGSHDVQVHGNVAHLFYPKEIPYGRNNLYEFPGEQEHYVPPELPIITYYQVGLEYEFLISSRRIRHKALVEIFINNSTYLHNYAAFGFRMYGRRVSFDFALMGEASEISNSYPILPYFAIKYKF